MFRLVGSLGRISLIMVHVTLEPYKPRKSVPPVGVMQFFPPPERLLRLRKFSRGVKYEDGWTPVNPDSSHAVQARHTDRADLI